MTTITRKSWRKIGPATLVLDLDNGSKVVLSSGVDPNTGDNYLETALNGTVLDGPEVDGEAELPDLYAPIGLPFAELMACREEVFQQGLRDAEHADDARAEESARRFARRAS